jgi:hypothetical protein
VRAVWRLLSAAPVEERGSAHRLSLGLGSVSPFGGAGADQGLKTLNKGDETPVKTLKSLIFRSAESMAWNYSVFS